jgi:hypothetical protein
MGTIAVKDLMIALEMIATSAFSVGMFFCLLKLHQFIKDAGRSKIIKERCEHILLNESNQPPWEPWFAWRPVMTISGERMWWTQVYRKIGNTYVDYDDYRWYHYGTEFDILKGTE